jgi:hypothetical protein
MTTIADSFTKELFNSLNLEWNSQAEARDLLTEIFVEEETIATSLEDVIFSLSQFFDYVCSQNGQASSKKKLNPFYVIDDDSYHMYICENSKIVFGITDSEEGFIFKKSEDDGVDCVVCENLQDLQFFLLLWFKDFYQRYEGNVS